MPSDIRLDRGVLDHPKITKLEQRLGAGAFKCLLRLWIYASQYRPKGVLTDFDPETIELTAQWKGEPGEFTRCLLSLKLLDMVDGQYAIHDWEMHQPWAFHSEERSRTARANAMKRWVKEPAPKKQPEPQKPSTKPRDNGICSVRGCNNIATINIMGNGFCSLPAHRNSMFGGVLK